MTDEQIIKALECCIAGKTCRFCPLKTDDACFQTVRVEALNLINRQKAEVEQKDIEISILIEKKESAYDEISELKEEVERLHNLQKPTETSGFKIENGKVVFYTNMLNGYRHELKDLNEVVEELNLMLQEAYKTDEISGYLKVLQENYKTAKSEAVKEFAELANPILEEIVDIMFDGNEPKCRIKNCHEHSSIPCESPTCIEENKAYWKVRILNLVKEMVGETND